MQIGGSNSFIFSTIFLVLSSFFEAPHSPADPLQVSMTNPHQGRKPNRLIREKSPYLLQHAYNPVDWYPWGEEAFARARAENKAIFLSIGYSTCHWCHVMERESFENDSIAALLNEFFIPIKVDREERPDIDRVYMTALQAMGQNGGWPMSMFLTPDRRPFYGGTYFPPDARYGRAGFPDVLRKIHDIWMREHDRVEESAAGISVFLRDIERGGPRTEAVTESTMARCFDQIAGTYDGALGGFGSGPKFPRPVVFDFLLRYFEATGKAEARDMVLHTLRAMAAGGMYDQIGGGFHRYAVDAGWRVPHFEKMLYDQAQLVQALCDAFLLTRDDHFASNARETLDYVLRDMTGDEGGFTSAEDADSPVPDNPRASGEGAFYVWTRGELDGLLGSNADVLAFRYGVEAGGNVQVDPQQEFAGKNILYQARTIRETGVQFGLTEAEVVTRLGESRRALFAARSLRPRPLRDDKILTSWNGLMIGACARAWRVLGDGRYGAAAVRAADFVLTRLYDPGTGALRRRYRDGDAGLEAHLDDYAFLVSGLLDLYEASGNGRWLRSAVQLTEKAIALFHDAERGGFFDTSGADTTVLVRLREHYDGAEPAGSSMAAMNLVRLSRMVDRPAWGTLASGAVAQAAAALNAQPVAMPLMVAVVGALAAPPRQVVIAGPVGDPSVEAMVRIVYASYQPGTVILHTDCGEEGKALEELNPSTGSLRMIGGKPVAYVCRNFACDLPATDPKTLAAQLTAETPRR